MLRKDKDFDCYTCKHRRNIAGDCHISCACPKHGLDTSSGLLGLVSLLAGRVGAVCSSNAMGVSLNPHGIKNGWCYWPFNFDPIWVNSCNSYDPKNGAYQKVTLDKS